MLQGNSNGPEWLVNVLTVVTSIGGAIIGAYVRTEKGQAKQSAEISALSNRIDSMEADTMVTQQLAIEVARTGEKLDGISKRIDDLKKDLRDDMTEIRSCLPPRVKQ